MTEESEKIEDKILLESGTNEVEVLEFEAAEKTYGVNVAKIKLITPLEKEKLVKVPLSPKEIAGIYPFQDKTISIINLKNALNIEGNYPEKKFIMICEFNNLINGFIISKAKKIHRTSWKNLQTINSKFSKNKYIVGVIVTNGIEIPLLDLETLTLNINPNLFKEQEEKRTNAKQTTAKIIVAEDSGLMRKQIVKKLNSSGIETIDFSDGEKAYEYITKTLNKIKDQRLLKKQFNIILTDIEMPQMDGLTLCKKIKKELRIDIPVVIFSSLISKDMAHKCEKVGADAIVNKPNFNALIETLLSILNKNNYA